MSDISFLERQVKENLDENEPWILFQVFAYYCRHRGDPRGKALLEKVAQLGHAGACFELVKDRITSLSHTSDDYYWAYKFINEVLSKGRDYEKFDTGVYKQAEYRGHLKGLLSALKSMIERDLTQGKKDKETEEKEEEEKKVDGCQKDSKGSKPHVSIGS